MVALASFLAPIASQTPLDGEDFDARTLAAMVALGERAVPVLLDAVRHGAIASPEDQRRVERAHGVIRSLSPEAMRTATRELVMSIVIGESFLDADTARTLAAIALLARVHDDRDLARSLANAAEAVHDRRGRFAMRDPFIVNVTDLKPDASGRLTFTFPTRLRRADRRVAAPSWAWHRIAIRVTAIGEGADSSKLVAALVDDDPFVRELAAAWLGMRDDRSAEVLDALRVAMRSSAPAAARFGRETDELARCAAATALARLAPNDQDARRGLTLLLRSDDPRERAVAAMAIRASDGPGAFDVVPALMEASADDDPLVAAEAITALGRVGVARDDVLTRLREFAAQDGALAVRAKSALRRLER